MGRDHDGPHRRQIDHWYRFIHRDRIMNKFINSGHYTTKPAVLLASLISGDKIRYQQLSPLVGFRYDGGIFGALVTRTMDND